MSAAYCTTALLAAGCFTLATWVGPRIERSSSEQEGGFLAQTFGESRRLFANHFFTRSDVYFHSGYYPSIFDQATTNKENHLAEHAGAEAKKNPAHGEAGHVHDEHEEEEHDFLGKPKDPMDAFT